MDESRATPATRSGYVLKGFPRRSETFIASEIHRLEQLGVALRLFVLKPADEPDRHPVVDRIRAVPSYLPATTSLSGSSRHPVAGRATSGRSCRRSAPSRAAVPAGLARAAGMALAQAVRARRHRSAAPRKIYLKELLLAVALAQRVLDDPAVAHLHAHFAHGSTTVTWLAATITGLPFSFTGHAKDLYSDELNPAGLLARKAAAAALRGHLHRGQRAPPARRSAPSTPVHVIHHGLSSDFATLTADRGGAPPRPGPADPGRRPAGAQEGLRHLRRGVRPAARARACRSRRSSPESPATTSPWCASWSRAHRLERRVTLLGPLTPRQLYDEYRRATVFSLACRVVDDGDRDGIPNVLVEAMACATPVVTTDVSGIPELVHDGANGLLVPPDDPRRPGRRSGPASGRTKRWPAASPRPGGAPCSSDFDGDRLAVELARVFAAHAVPALEAVS